MDFELQPTSTDDASLDEQDAAEDASFRISSQPIVNRTGAGESPTDALDLPRSYGTQTLCLMARDPRTLFAYWDIDWKAAFKDGRPKDRKVLLRILGDDEAELSATEVEPMAGNCYVTVSDADTAYRGEIGYFDSANIWNGLASSEIVTTPAEAVSPTEDVDFATVPFHLSFQHMIDLLRISKQENESLTSMLADLRTRAASADGERELSPEEHDLARIMDEVAAASASTGSRIPGRSDFWTQERIQRILGVGGSSPSEGFGGGLNSLTGLGGSSRPL